MGLVGGPSVLGGVLGSQVGLQGSLAVYLEVLFVGVPWSESFAVIGPEIMRLGAFGASGC